MHAPRDRPLPNASPRPFLKGLTPLADDAVRVEAISGSGIAVRDVLASCRRQGSLDAAIDRGNIRVDPIDGLAFSPPARQWHGDC